jgi:hypothetical protein
MNTSHLKYSSSDKNPTSCFSGDGAEVDGDAAEEGGGLEADDEDAEDRSWWSSRLSN